MFCPKCGARMPDDATAAFCMSCGSPLPKMSEQSMRPAQEQDILNMLNRAQQTTAQPESILPVEPTAVQPVVQSALQTQEVYSGQGSFDTQATQQVQYPASQPVELPADPAYDAQAAQSGNYFGGRPLNDVLDEQAAQPDMFSGDPTDNLAEVQPTIGVVEEQIAQPSMFSESQLGNQSEVQPTVGAVEPQAGQLGMFQESQPGNLFDEASQTGVFESQAAQPELFASEQQDNLFQQSTQADILDGQPAEGMFVQGAYAPQPLEPPAQMTHQPEQPATVHHSEQKDHGSARQQVGGQAQAKPQQAAPQTAKTAEITAARPTAAQIQERLMAQQTVAIPVPAENSFAAESPPRPSLSQPMPQAQRPAKQSLPSKPPKPPKPIPAYEDEGEEPKRGGGKTLVTILGFFVVFVVLLAVVTLGMLMFFNRSGATISQFVDAVSAGDAAAIESMIEDNKLVVQGIQPDSDDWAALFSAFDNTEATTTLTSQLNQQADGGSVDAEQLTYAAIGIESQELFWFIKHYHITITTVDLSVPAADGTTTLWLDTQSFGGVPAEGGAGMTYTGLMPGRYSMRLESTGGAGLTTQAEDIELFKSTIYEPVQVGYSVTISGCVSDIAVLYVNKQAVEAVPVNGVVTIPNVVLGALIEIEAEVDGIVYRSNVSFTDSSVTNLEFANYTQEIPGQSGDDSSSASSDAAAPVQPTAAEIDALLVEFYTSYLECINQQSMAPIKGTTTSYNTELAARITSDNNKPYEFQYVSTACDYESVGTFDDGARIRVNAAFAYNYRDRDTQNEYTAGSNQQTVELVWQNGQWLVNGMSFVNENDFNSHTRVD